MKQITLEVEESRYALFLQFLYTLDYVQVKKENSKYKVASIIRPKYDFSDLSGKLEWRGDAVAEQRSLRDEW